MTSTVRTARPRTRGLLRRSTAPVLAAAVALGVALSGCSSSDAGTGEQVSGSESTQSQAAPELKNPDVSRVALWDVRNKHLEQQIITTGVLDLTDVVTELGFQNEKGDRYTGAPLSEHRDEWPADTYSTELRPLDNGQIALRWRCDAVDGTRLNVDSEAFCDTGGYVILLEPGANPNELPVMEEVVTAPVTEIDDLLFLEIGVMNSPKARSWPTAPTSPLPSEVMVDGVKQQVISAVQPDGDEALVYFVTPGSFNLYVGQMAAKPEAEK